MELSLLDLNNMEPSLHKLLKVKFPKTKSVFYVATLISKLKPHYEALQSSIKSIQDNYSTLDEKNQKVIPKEKVIEYNEKLIELHENKIEIDIEKLLTIDDFPSDNSELTVQDILALSPILKE